MDHRRVQEEPAVARYGETSAHVLLDIRAVIETDSVTTPRAGEPVADLFERFTLTTAAEEYAWINAAAIAGRWRTPRASIEEDAR